VRPVRVLPVADPTVFLAELRRALAAGEEAVLPVPAGDDPHAGGRDELDPVPHSVAVVIETSGSTGAPKRVMLSTDALLASAAASSVALGGDGQWLLALPAHYIAGVQVLVRSLAAGTEPVLLPPGRFDPAVFAEHAGRMEHPVRFTSLVPVQLARLLDAAATDTDIGAVLAGFTGVLVGGQAVPADLVERAERAGIRLFRTYGSSETAGGCVYNGVPLGGTVVSAVDGELLISGPTLAEGYLGDAAGTRDRFVDVAGVRWYRTGDLGAVAADGTVSVTGRADNVIISGGQKVSLDAVEALVRGLAGLEEAVVVRAADPEWGEVPVVVLAGRAGTVSLAVVRGAVGDALGPAARPARLVTAPAIPLLPSGKPDRRSLAALAAAAG
jgi:O-succinylbenzoic acid--CoA ligase